MLVADLIAALRNGHPLGATIEFADAAGAALPYGHIAVPDPGRVVIVLGDEPEPAGSDRPDPSTVVPGPGDPFGPAGAVNA